jgi:hypothetical protein
MTLKKRIDDIEKVVPTDEPDCQRVIYRLCTTKEDVDSTGPSEAEVEAYLKETGRCEKCTTRRCFLIYQPGTGFEPLRE